MPSSIFQRETILNTARRTTGLSDFGGDDFEAPLEAMLNDYNHHADLNFFGKFGASMYLHRMMSNRLRLTEIDRKGLIPDVSINRPVFILGLPRTGSTLLHELMATHTKLRAPVFWETTFVPGKNLGDSLRRGTARGQIAIVDVLAPSFRSIHSLGTHLPHECVTIQAMALRSMQFHAVHRMHEYNTWLATCDWQPAYAWHERHLKWLQGDTPTRWVLKAPGHLLGIDALLERYPDAQFIQLHRNPAETMASMASFYVHLRKPFSHRMDPEEIGQDLVEQWHGGLMKTLDLRASDAAINAKFLDVHYRDLVTSPLQTARQIGSFIDQGLSEYDELLMSDYLNRNPKGKHGSHTYTLDEFNLNEAELADRFDDYNRQYDLVN